MTKRITRAMLESKAATINSLLEKPADCLSGGQWCIGNFHIDGAYGGYALHQVANDAGGTHDVFWSGHMTARQLFDRMTSFISGIQAARA